MFVVGFGTMHGPHRHVAAHDWCILFYFLKIGQKKKKPKWVSGVELVQWELADSTHF